MRPWLSKQEFVFLPRIHVKCWVWPPVRHPSAREAEAGSALELAVLSETSLKIQVQEHAPLILELERQRRKI